MKNIVILGITGSIGTQTLEVIKEIGGFNIVGASFGKNYQLMDQILEEFNISYVASFDKEAIGYLDNKHLEINFFNDINKLLEIKDVDIVLNAVSGYHGIIYSYNTLKNGKDLLLANKESLVAIGPMLKQMAKDKGLKIIPIDSEHTSLLDLISHTTDNIQKCYITASGGALRDKSLDELKNVTLKDTLNHPTWKMGQKITIDSATMMNKAFEVIEACYLFDIDIDDLEVLMDYQSIVHALIETKNRLIPHVSSTTMKNPIKYALLNNNLTYNSYQDNLSKDEVINKYSLRKLDIKRYPLILLSKYCLNKKFNGIILTTVNDSLVEMFINNKIDYLTLINNISEFFMKFKDNYENLEYNIENILKVEKKVEKEVKKLCK